MDLILSVTRTALALTSSESVPTHGLIVDILIREVLPEGVNRICRRCSNCSVSKQTRRFWIRGFSDRRLIPSSDHLIMDHAAQVM